MQVATSHDVGENERLWKKVLLSDEIKNFIFLVYIQNAVYMCLKIKDAVKNWKKLW